MVGGGYQKTGLLAKIFGEVGAGVRVSPYPCPYLLNGSNFGARFNVSFRNYKIWLIELHQPHLRYARTQRKAFVNWLTSFRLNTNIAIDDHFPTTKILEAPQ